MHNWLLKCIFFSIFFFSDSVCCFFLELQSQAFFSPWCDPSWIFAWTKKARLTTLYYFRTTWELEITPRLCLPSDGMLHSTHLWDSQAISSSFHCRLSFTKLREHAVWKIHTLMPHTRLGSPNLLAHRAVVEDEIRSLQRRRRSRADAIDYLVPDSETGKELLQGAKLD